MVKTNDGFGVPTSKERMTPINPHAKNLSPPTLSPIDAKIEEIEERDPLCAKENADLLFHFWHGYSLGLKKAKELLK